MDFTKLGVTQYEEIRPSNRPNAVGDNVQSQPFSLKNTLKNVTEIPEFKVLRKSDLK